MPHVMSVLDLSNASARSVTVNDTVKKSYAAFALVGSILSLGDLCADIDTYCVQVSKSPWQCNQYLSQRTECIPCPSDERDKEVQPLLGVE